MPTTLATLLGLQGRMEKNCGGGGAEINRTKVL